MNSITDLHATSNAWLFGSVIAPYAKAFIALLAQGRYSTHTASNDFASIARLAHWMTCQRLPLD